MRKSDYKNDEKKWWKNDKNDENDKKNYEKNDKNDEKIWL